MKIVTKTKGEIVAKDKIEEQPLSLVELLSSEEGLKAIRAMLNHWKLPFPEVEWVGGEDNKEWEWKILQN